MLLITCEDFALHLEYPFMDPKALVRVNVGYRRTGFSFYAGYGPMLKLAGAGS